MFYCLWKDQLVSRPDFGDISLLPAEYYYSYFLCSLRLFSYHLQKSHFPYIFCTAGYVFWADFYTMVYKPVFKYAMVVTHFMTSSVCGSGVAQVVTQNQILTSHPLHTCQKLWPPGHYDPPPSTQMRHSNRGEPGNFDQDIGQGTKCTYQ